MARAQPIFQNDLYTTKYGERNDKTSFNIYALKKRRLKIHIVCVRGKRIDL